MKKILILAFMSLVGLSSSGQHVFKKILPGVDVYHDQGMIYFSRPVQIDSISCDSKSETPLLCDGKTFYAKIVDIIPEIKGENISDEVYAQAYLCSDSIYILDFQFKSETVRNGFLGLMTESFDTRKYLGYFPSSSLNKMQVIYKTYKYNHVPSLSVFLLLMLMVLIARNIFYMVDDVETIEGMITGIVLGASLVLYLLGVLRGVSIDGLYIFLGGTIGYYLTLRIFSKYNRYNSRLYFIANKCENKLFFDLKWLLCFCSVMVCYYGVLGSTENFLVLLMLLPAFALLKLVQNKWSIIKSFFHKIVPERKIS